MSRRSRRAPRRCLVAVVTCFAVVGCGPRATGAHLAGGGDARSVAGTTPLIAVLDSPFGTVPNAVRLVTADGVPVATAALAPDAEAVAAVGRRLLVAGGGHLRSIGPTGTVDDLGLLTDDGEGWLVRGLVGSPDGRAWAWAAVTQDAQGVAEVRIHVADLEGTRTLLSRTETGRALQPVAWTRGGLVVADEPLGIGGYTLFRRTFGPTEVLDPRSGALRPLADASCAFSDLAADGRLACIVDGREGPHGPGPVTLRLVGGHGPTIDVPLPPPVAQAGAALFSPDAHLLTLATSPALADGAEVITDVLVDPATGSLRSLPVAGLTPTAWLDPERFLAYRSPETTGGPPGSYLVHPDGRATRLAAAWNVVGILS